MEKKLTPTQVRMLKWMRNTPNGMRQVGGDGMAPYLQSCRALVRKGLLIEVHTSYFALTEEGEKHS